MNSKDETVLTNAKMSSFLLEGGNAEMSKLASNQSSVIRRRVREQKFVESILPRETVGKGDLYKLPGSESPTIRIEVEPDSPGATIISFEDTGDTIGYTGQEAFLQFFGITTPVFKKNIINLMVWDSDIRGMLTDNAIKDMVKKEDYHFMNSIENIIGTAHGVASDETGVIQYTRFEGGITRDSWSAMSNFLPSRFIPEGVYLMNNVTFSQFKRWGRDEMGGDFAQDLFKSGNKAWEKTEIGGITVIVTMHADLVPNGVVYQFAPPEFLGRNCELVAPTLYVKKDIDMLSFHAREYIGMAIVNTAAIHKVEFAGIANENAGYSILGPNDTDKVGDGDA